MRRQPAYHPFNVRPEISVVAITGAMLFLAGQGIERFVPDMLDGASDDQLLLFAADLAGVAIFAFLGAHETARITANRFRPVAFHLIFSLFAGLVTATAGGGVVRDVLMVGSPPWFLSAPLHVVVAVMAALFGYAMHRDVGLAKSATFRILDHVSLGVFSACGASIALQQTPVEFGAEAYVDAFLFAGATATGGGILRDVLLLRRAPVGLRTTYTFCAAVGGLIYVALGELTSNALPQQSQGFLWIATALMVTALAEATRNWRLPALHSTNRVPSHRAVLNATTRTGRAKPVQAICGGDNYANQICSAGRRCLSAENC